MPEFLDEIVDINTVYLMLAKNMISRDKQTAAFRLGISLEVANKISSMSVHEMLKIAKSNQVVFNFRFKMASEINALTKVSRIGKLQPIHTGIILSSQLQK
jgi:flagellar transcriptional activator FlhD